MNKLAALAALLGVCCLLWLAQDYKRFSHTPLTLTQEVGFTVESGMSQTALVLNWQNQGWLRHAQRDIYWLKLRAKVLKDQATIKAGRYLLYPGQSLVATMQRIQRGDVQRYSFTIIEGWSFQRLREELRGQDHLSQTSAEWDEQAIMQALGKPEVHPEGQFLPETYHYQYGAADLDIYRQAHEAMQQALSQAWQTRESELPLSSAYEALVLASIIEKETARADERPLIAGVFINRLRKGMRLQTDPTVIYGLGASFDGNLRRRDLRRDTPYNTYTRKGLPPSPIALPSRAAIHAAVQPEATNKLYFVATGEDGRHYFSASLAEHQAAVKRYQLK